MLIALTQVLLTVIYRFNDTTFAQHNSVLQLQSPLHCIVHSRCDIRTWQLIATHNYMTLALYATLCTSRILYPLLVGIFPEHYGSIYLSPLHSGRGMPSCVPSEASQVIMLLDTAVFCYNIIISCMKKPPD